MGGQQKCSNCGEDNKEKIWCEVATVDRKTKASAGTGTLIGGIVLSVIGLICVAATVGMILEGSSREVFQKILVPGLGVFFFLRFGVRFIVQFLRADRVKLHKYTCSSCNFKWQLFEGEENITTKGDSGQPSTSEGKKAASSEVSPERIPGPEGKIVRVACHWCNQDISGTSLETNVFFRKGLVEKNIVGFICPSCNTASHAGCKKSGIEFKIFLGFRKSICGECGAKVVKPLIIIETERARKAGILLQ